jgi:hypothetical protein
MRTKARIIKKITKTRIREDVNYCASEIKTHSDSDDNEKFHPQIPPVDGK